MRSTSDVRKARSRTPAALHLDWVKPRLRHSGIVSESTWRSSRPTAHRDAPAGVRTAAVEDKADIRCHTSRRPVADHRAPSNDLQPDNLESVVADQLQRRSHDRAATRRRMQAEADLGDPVAFQPKIDAAAEAALGSLAPPRWSSRVVHQWSNRRRSVRGTPRRLVVGSHPGGVGTVSPADHRGIAALLHHRGEIASCAAARSVTPASASIRIGTASGNARAVGAGVGSHRP